MLKSDPFDELTAAVVVRGDTGGQALRPKEVKSPPEDTIAKLSGEPYSLGTGHVHAAIPMLHRLKDYGAEEFAAGTATRDPSRATREFEAEDAFRQFKRIGKLAEAGRHNMPPRWRIRSVAFHERVIPFPRTRKRKEIARPGLWATECQEETTREAVQ